MLRLSFEHDAAHRAVFVLERKVMMPGGIELVVGDLAAHIDLLQLRHLIKQALDQLIDLADGKDRPLIQSLSLLSVK